MIMPTMRDNNRDGYTAPKRDLMTIGEMPEDSAAHFLLVYQR